MLEKNNVLQLLKKLYNEHLYAMSLYARQIAGTIVLLLVVRFLSVYDYGLFASYNNIITFYLLFANPGLSEYILVSSQNRIKEIQLKIGIFILYSILVSGLIYTGSNFVPLESHLIFILVLIRSYLDNTQPCIMFSYFQASKKFNLVSYINLFYSLMTIAIAIICYYFKLSLIKFLSLGILLGLINIIQYSYHAKINYLLVIKNFKRLIKQIDKSIFIYAGTSLTFFAYNKLPGLYVATFIKKENAALFFAAFAISNIITILLGAQYQKMIPEMIKTSALQIKRIIKNNLIFMMTINIVLLIILAITGKFILHLLYSKDYYLNAYPFLLLLTCSNIAISYAYVYGAYLTASGHQDVKLKTMLVASIITIIVISGTYQYGIYAAILSYTISAIFMSVVYRLISKYFLKIQAMQERLNY